MDLHKSQSAHGQTDRKNKNQRAMEALPQPHARGKGALQLFTDISGTIMAQLHQQPEQS